MGDKIKFFALGGLDEHGKNMYVIEINNDIFVFDCGLKHPDDLLPGVDALIPNIDYLKKNKNRVKAYFISHGHTDKFGALPYVFQEVPAPIYTSKFTANIIEIETKKLGIKNNYHFEYIESSEIKFIANRRFRFIQVTHSIPFSYMAIMETTYGNIVYSTDYVLDFTSLPDGYTFSLDDVRGLINKNCLLLLQDSINANVIGHASPNYNLPENVKKTFENSTGRIYFALFKNNYYSLREILELSYKNHKTVVFLDDDEAKYYENVIKDFHSSSSLIKTDFEKFSNIKQLNRKDTVIIIVNESHSLFKDIINFAEGNDKTKKVDFSPDDTFILRTPPVASNEIIATEALDTCYKTGCKIISFSKKEIKSMHSCQEDIKAIISFFKPKYYVPINGSYSKLMANAKLALSTNKKFNYSNIFVLDNGVTLNIDENSAKADFKNLLPVGDILVDGTDIGRIESNDIEERNKMSTDGVVILAVSVSKAQKTIIGGPDVQMRGFVFLKDSENIVKNITDLFLDQVNVYLSGYEDKKYFEERAIEKISAYLYRETKKNPVILPTLIEID